MGAVSEEEGGMIVEGVMAVLWLSAVFSLGETGRTSIRKTVDTCAGRNRSFIS